ncbi:RNA polymerase III subunit RPC82-domain-containing protein [Syncephalis fuscata]|nr:RNA polymerase III subunit RPC82-domain-containing protein [Syncephalis fuscata]
MLTMQQTVRKIAGPRPKLDQKNALTASFTKLVSERFLVAVRIEDTQTKYDRDVMADEQRLDKIGALPTAKQVAEVQSERNLREEEEMRSGNVVGLKRKLPTDMSEFDEPKSKKQNSDGISNVEVEENIYFGINFERFNIRLRNQQIVRYFVERVNRAAGAVINTLLTLIEPNIYSLKDSRSKSKSLMQIGHHIPTSVDLASSIVFDDHYSGRVRPRNELISELLDVMVADVSGVLIRTDSRGGGEYAIAFDRVNALQKRKAIESTALEHFGNAACRILKLLYSRGKMDEKQVSRLVMLPMKDTRELLQALALYGFAELQEVPKSIDRAPSRTFFLWYVPIEKCYRVLLRNALRTLGNLRQRRHNEREKQAALIAKSERIDVKENANLLSESEHTMLKELRATLYRLGRAELELLRLIVTLQ